MQFEGVSVPPACFRIPTSQYSSIVAQFVVIAALLVAAVGLQGEALREACCEYRCQCRRRRIVAVVGSPHDAGQVEGASPRSARVTVVPVIALAPLTADEHGELKSSAAASSTAVWLRRGRRLVFVLLCALYGTVTGTVLATLRCHTVSIPARTYARLDGDGTTLKAAGLTDDIGLLQACDDFPYQPACNDVVATLDVSVSVSVLTSNPNAVCWESAHRMAAGLAVVLLAVYVVAFPLGLGWLLRLRMRGQLLLTGMLSRWRAVHRADREARQRWIVAGGQSVSRRWCRRVIVACCWPRLRAHDPGTAVLAAANEFTQLLTARRGVAGDRYAVAAPQKAPPSAAPEAVHVPTASPDSPPSLRPRVAAETDASPGSAGDVGTTRAPLTERLPDGHASPAGLPGERRLSTRIAWVAENEDVGPSPASRVDGNESAQPSPAADAAPARLDDPVGPQARALAPVDLQRDAPLSSVCLDTFPLAHPDPLLHAAALGEYRASHLTFHVKAMLLLLCLTLAQAVLQPTSRAAVIGQAATTIALLLAFMAHVWITQPTKPDRTVGRFIGYYTMWVAIIQALLNCVAALIALPSGDGGGATPDLLRAFLVVSYMATIAALGLFVLVVAAFLHAVASL